MGSIHCLFAIVSTESSCFGFLRSLVYPWFPRPPIFPFYIPAKSDTFAHRFDPQPLTAHQTDDHPGRSRGFGFVTFVDVKSAEAAVDGMKDVELDGR